MEELLFFFYELKLFRCYSVHYIQVEAVMRHSFIECFSMNLFKKKVSQ
jgi:hypothetical protein